MPFPFKELQPPEFFIEMNWDLSDFFGFLGSWSSTRRYLEKNGTDPLDIVREDFQSAWGQPDEKRLVRWLLHTRMGKVDSAEL